MTVFWVRVGAWLWISVSKEIAVLLTGNQVLLYRITAMPIPNYQQIMLPLLTAISDGQTYRHRDVIEKLANRFQITDEERKELLPSGQQSIFENRVGWARTYLNIL
jgi:hypothetical protein